MHSWFQAVKEQYNEGTNIIKTVDTFVFPSTSSDGVIEINFDREQPGGWHLALENSSEVKL